MYDVVLKMNVNFSGYVLRVKLCCIDFEVKTYLCQSGIVAVGAVVESIVLMILFVLF